MEKQSPFKWDIISLETSTYIIKSHYSFQLILKTKPRPFTPTHFPRHPRLSLHGARWQQSEVALSAVFRVLSSSSTTSSTPLFFLLIYRHEAVG